tara:strand:- start:645 stop:1196 length:552 start_codon:yes stop_codon:yes gene_type:complete
MANYEATRYDFSGANLSGVEGVNTGLIVPWSSTSVPSGFLECNGAAVSRTTYSALFAIIGTTYGTGDGSTTFNVPDLAERCCQAKGPATNLGTKSGSATVSVTGNVAGNIANTTIDVPTMAAHAHPKSNAMSTGGGSQAGGGGSTGAAGGGGAHTHALSSASFTGDAISTLQQTLTLIYIIKT